MTDKEYINKCECTCDECGAECEPFWKKENNEPIMIDGVDVSECVYFIGHEPPSEQGTWGGAIHKGACKIYSKDCKYNNNCYFKQLARSTQRIKDLEERIINHSKEIEEYCSRLADKNKECEELKKYLKEIGVNLGLNVNTSIIGESALEHWAILSSSINYAIENLQQECEELKTESFTREELITLQEKDIDRYRKALEEIEEYLKLPTNVCLTDCPEYSIGQVCSQNCFDNRLKILLDIINKAKGVE